MWHVCKSLQSHVCTLWLGPTKDSTSEILCCCDRLVYSTWHYSKPLLAAECVTLVPVLCLLMITGTHSKLSTMNVKQHIHSMQLISCTQVTPHVLKLQACSNCGKTPCGLKAGRSIQLRAFVGCCSVCYQAYLSAKPIGKFAVRSEHFKKLISYSHHRPVASLLPALLVNATWPATAKPHRQSISDPALCIGNVSRRSASLSPCCCKGRGELWLANMHEHVSSIH